MKMQMAGHMRMEQRMKLAPRMIQSMEVLQLPLLALQEKIEAELNSNPVLEQVEEQPEEVEGADGAPGADTDAESDADAETVEQAELVVKDDSDNIEDFQRLDSLGEDFDDYLTNPAPIRVRRSGEETNRKYEALQNTAAAQQSMHEFLLEQWRMLLRSRPPS